jgi:hypothetical protein
VIQWLLEIPIPIAEEADLMAKNITISLTDAEYESLRAASAAAHQTPEELAVVTITQRFAPIVPRVSPSVENVLNHLRAQGLLVETPSGVDTSNLPPPGTPERAQFEAELTDEVSAAFDQAGLNILDYIERR